MIINPLPRVGVRIPPVALGDRMTNWLVLPNVARWTVTWTAQNLHWEIKICYISTVTNIASARGARASDHTLSWTPANSGRWLSSLGQSLLYLSFLSIDPQEFLVVNWLFVLVFARTFSKLTNHRQPLTAYLPERLWASNRMNGFFEAVICMNFKVWFDPFAEVMKYKRYSLRQNIDMIYVYLSLEG